MKHYPQCEVRGVNWDPKSKKWRAQIKVLGRTHYLGLYDTKHEAAEERYKAEKNYEHFAGKYFRISPRVKIFNPFSIVSDEQFYINWNEIFGFMNNHVPAYRIFRGIDRHVDDEVLFGDAEDAQEGIRIQYMKEHIA